MLVTLITEKIWIWTTPAKNDTWFALCFYFSRVSKTKSGHDVPLNLKETGGIAREMWFLSWDEPCQKTCCDAEQNSSDVENQTTIYIYIVINQERHPHNFRTARFINKISYIQRFTKIRSDGHSPAVPWTNRFRWKNGGQNPKKIPVKGHPNRKET